MGAKQSKRSVDISGKEAEGASEVAAAGAGGEGRVEQLADADALKPQLNGDAHLHEASEKEKKLDSGTPENEKDATTEKESKEQDDEKEKEAAPIANGENEQKVENGDNTTSHEDGKKPKKEKVKKKWSLRSISFSRKDKPKPEKKQKDEESKTNGEPDKLPEETAELSPETEKNEIVAEEKVETETKEEKTPDTPVTEPITNGSATPETPKEEMLIADEAIANSHSKENDTAETPKDEVQKESLPVNSHPIEEPKNKTPEPVETENSKPDVATDEKSESAPRVETPVEKEVCVEKLPLIEPTPPPLPANPPPSSVASFAATTMAPELAAPLAHDLQPAEPIPADVLPAEPSPAPASDTAPGNDTQPIGTIQTECDPAINNQNAEVKPLQPSISVTDADDITTEQVPTEVPVEVTYNNIAEDVVLEQNKVTEKVFSPEDNSASKADDDEDIETSVDEESTKLSTNEVDDKAIENVKEDSSSQETINEVAESGTHLCILTNGLTETVVASLVKETNIVENGTIETEEAMTNGDMASCAPPSPPAPAAAPQEIAVPPVADKLVDLMPEVPSVPELTMDLESSALERND